MSVERTGGRYVRDPKSKQLTQVDGPALRAAAADEKAKAAAAEAAKKDKAPAAPKSTPPAAEKE